MLITWGRGVEGLLREAEGAEEALREGPSVQRAVCGMLYVPHPKANLPQAAQPNRESPTGCSSVCEELALAWVSLPVDYAWP